jgi:uncharacterized protein (DUF58 family)
MFHLDKRFFIAIGAEIFLFVLGFMFPVLFVAGRIGILALALLVVIDVLLIYRTKDGIRAVRETPEKLSNGDDNEIRIYVENFYVFAAKLTIVDELPFQFQKRDATYSIVVPSGKSSIVAYNVRPVERGEYHFGAVNIYVSTPVGLLQRRFRFAVDRVVPVYPSYVQMRRYELLAVTNRLTEVGVKKIRRIGQTMEFDQIRSYVRGDDYRTINTCCDFSSWY